MREALAVRQIVQGTLQRTAAFAVVRTKSAAAVNGAVDLYKDGEGSLIAVNSIGTPPKPGQPALLLSISKQVMAVLGRSPYTYPDSPPDIMSFNPNA